MKKPTRSLAISGTAALALLVSSCGTSAKHSSAASTSVASNVNVSGVTLQVGDQAGTGAQALLTASGLISQLRFKVAWHDFTSGPPIMQAMSSNSVDFGQVGNSPPIFSIAGGAKVAFVGALQNGPNDDNIVVPKGSPIHSIAQLKGKKVAVAQGTAGNFNLLAVLQHSHLNISDVQADYLQPAPALAAFTSGGVQAWDTWSPYTEQVEVENGATSIANSSSYGNYSYNLASRAALADPAKNAAIRDLVSLLNQARLWANTHSQQWAAAWGQSTGLPPAVMTKAAVDSNETPVPITQAVIGSEQDLVNQFSKAGLIPQAPQVKSYFDTEYNNLYPKSS